MAEPGPVGAELPLDALDAGPAEIAARFRGATRAGTPAWLWPEVSPADWAAALARLERALARMVAGEPRVALEPGAAALSALRVALHTSGVGPLLGHWLEAGRLDAPEDAAALLRLHLRHARLRQQRLRAELARALPVLQAAGAAPTLLKGAHTARVYFPEPAARPLADLDIFVAPPAIRRAERALADAGYRAGSPQRRPYRRDWAPPDAPVQLRSLYLTHADDPYTLDLHGSLDRNFFGVRRLRFDRAAGGLENGGRVQLMLGVGLETHGLAQPLLTVLLAAHGGEGLHQLSLLRVLELVLVIRQDTQAGTLDWVALMELAESAGGLRFCYPALALAERLAPDTVPPWALAQLLAAATPLMRAVVAGLTPATAQRIDRVSLPERTMWAATPGERLGRALHALWPAAAGGSPGRLGAIYRRRAWVLLRALVPGTDR